WVSVPGALLSRKPRASDHTVSPSRTTAATRDGTRLFACSLATRWASAYSVLANMPGILPAGEPPSTRYPASHRFGVGPTVDFTGLARIGTDVLGGRTDEFAHAFLFHDVCGPTRGAGRGEHRGHHFRRDLGEVEYHRGPEFHIGLNGTVRSPFPQFVQRRLLHRRRCFVTLRTERVAGPSY